MNEARTTSPEWLDAGSAEELARRPLHELVLGGRKLALSFRDGVFGAVSNACNHVGGPLGQGRLAGDYISCPWHGWKFHRCTGVGEPGYEQDAVPAHEVRVVNGRVEVRARASSERRKQPHAPHRLARPIERASGPVRVLGLSTTAMDPENPRYSTSEALLEVALEHARGALGCTTQLIRLGALRFRACEGYYSKSARACTWPCSITQMDPSDELESVYEALVHGSDVLLLATPIRWGQASSLYFRLAERLNCVQNQVTTHDRVLIRNKVAGFVITGGQDNIQGVAGQLLSFFCELGYSLPQFPFIAHSRGWTAEDMERNVAEVQRSEELRAGARALAERAVEHARLLIAHSEAAASTQRGERKAHRLEVEREARASREAAPTDD